MGVVFKPTGYSDKETKEIASIVFVFLAETEQLDDITIMEHPSLFVEWTPNWSGKAGTIVQDEGELYRSIHDIINVAQNTKPSETPSMWTHIGDPSDPFPPWEQPLGAHDGYEVGKGVTYNGEHYINEQPCNIYPPDVWGWVKVE